MGPLYSSFKAYFNDIEKQIADQRDLLNLRIQIASEEAASQERRTAVLYRNDAQSRHDQHIKQWDTVKQRWIQKNFQQACKSHRPQQVDALTKKKNKYSAKEGATFE